MFIAFDTETTGLDPFSATVFSFSTCDEQMNATVYRLDGTLLRRASNLANLHGLWENRDILKVMHNAKFDLQFASKCIGRDLSREQFEDTLILSKILRSHADHRLKHLGWELANIPRDDEKAVHRFVGASGDYSRVPEHIMHLYQKRDVERTMLLYKFFKPKIVASPAWTDIYGNEKYLVGCVMRMEQRGVCISAAKALELIAFCYTEAENAKQALARIAGKQVNPNASADIRWLLFDKLHLHSSKLTETGLKSTDKACLDDMYRADPQPVIRELQRFRAYAKGAKIVRDYLHLSKDGIIHPNINTWGAVTGRMSCSRPNLQNVARSESLTNPFPIPARRVFTPKPGFVNVHIDYSGIEIRIIAHFAGDKRLLDIIRSGGDPHSEAAKIFYGAAFTGDKKMRFAAKTTQFAIAYGAGQKKVHTTLGVSEVDGLGAYIAYRNAFPEVINLHKRMIAVASNTGYVDTLYGRRIQCTGDSLHGAVNLMVQGTAADIMKRAMERVDRFLSDRFDGQVGLILQIHDELVIECPLFLFDKFQRTLPELKKIMTDFPELDVPLEVEAALSSESWEKLTEWKIGT